MKRMLLSALLMLLTVAGAFAQLTIRGKIIDDTGAPVPSATVVVKGTTYGTTSDATGKYQFTCPSVPQSLYVSALGYLDKEVPYNRESVGVITLEPDRKNMNEVVVVAYGTAKKISLTGSVATVTAPQMDQRPLSNPLASLEGAAAGVQVNNTVGQPGSSPTIRIRGFASVNYSNDPLYVIDGVPFGGNVADINPADIESISVLKDAASSALYGARASNGVIIMTTKRGAKNNTSLNFTMNQGFYDKGINEYEKIGANDFMETMWAGYKHTLLSTQGSSFTNATAGAEASRSLVGTYLFSNIYNKPDTALFDANGKLVADASILPGYAGDLNWYNGIERVGKRSDYNLSARTGTDKNSVYFSVGYLNEQGYIKFSDFKRLSARVNADLQATKWFKYGVNVSGTHQIANNAPSQPSQSTSSNNPIYFARNIAPIYAVHAHDAVTGDYILDANGNQTYDNGDARQQLHSRNAIWENELNKLEVTRNTMQSQAYANITFLKNFTLSVVGDINTRSDEQMKYDNATIGDGVGQGRSARTNYRYLNYTARQTLTWSQKFMNVHIVDVMVGHENYNNQYTYLYAYKTDEQFVGQTQLENFGTMTSLTDYTYKYRTEGYFSRARYNYKDQYFLEASFRNDGSSKFFNPWGNFFSIGGSWIVSKEAFFDPLASKINFLKLRTSYGEVGSDIGLPYYAWQPLYDINQNANAAALYKKQNGSTNLLWEKSASIGIALESRIFDRANVMVEYFNKKSINLIFDVNQPLSAGATSVDDPVSIITKNIGSVANKGWEFTYDVDVVRTKDFRFNFGGNITFMKNKVIKLADENKDGIINGTKKIMEGHGIYDYWLEDFVGVDQMTGSALYNTDSTVLTSNGVTVKDKLYTTNPNKARRVWSGSSLPNVFGTFTTTFTYKNFILSGLFTWAKGGKVYDDTYKALMSASGTASAMHKDILKSWNGVPAGMTESSENRIDPNGVPLVDFNNSALNNGRSNRFLKDGSYMVVKNINLSYRFSKDLISRLQMKSLTAGITVDNLYTSTKLRGMNPQQSFDGVTTNTFVTPRVISFLLNVGL